MKTFNLSRTLNLITVTAALGCLCLAAGCGKKDAPPPATPGVSAEMQTTLTTLTDAARKYNIEKRQPPMSLEEVVAAGYLKSIPEAPAGKRFALNPRRVVVELVDQ
jgi:hypothetical protein